MEIKSTRENFTFLPSYSELQAILAKESKRPLPPENTEKHFQDFSTLLELMESFGLPTDFFQKNLSPADLDQFLQQVNLTGNQLIDLIQAHPEKKDQYNKVYDYLSEEDEVKPADLIFTFGAKTPARAIKTADLYEKGLSPLVMFSGGSPFYGQNHKNEAEKYKRIAIENGVPDQQIITENKSLTIPDNVRSSLNLLDQLQIQFHDLIVVNSPYVQRRGWVTMKKYLPQDKSIQRINCATIEKFSRDGWFNNVEGIRVIFNEFVKMKTGEILNSN